MAFFAITFAVMFICIFVIYWLARRLGVILDQRALLLCAVMAMIINFTSLKISSALTNNHYCLIAFLVLSSAAFVTFFQERIFCPASVPAKDLSSESIKNDLADLAETGTESSAPPIFADELAVAFNTAENSEPIEASAELSALTVTDESLEYIEENPVVAEEEPSDNNLITEISDRFEAELEARHAALSDMLATAASDPFVGSAETANELEFTEPLEPANIEISFEPSTEPVIAVDDNIVSDVTDDAEISSETKLEIAHEAEPQDVPEIKFAADIETIDSFTTLDEHLDYIFEQKQLNNQVNIIYASNQALIKYADDDYAPFIVIDIANLYKANGAYEAAIDVYRQAFNLKAVRGSKDMSEEFLKSLTYLEAVKYILSQHDAPETPFKDISSELLSEIEQEFSLRQKQTVS